MENSIITFEANGQTLVKTGGPSSYSSDTVGYIKAIFTLGENWTGYDAVKAIWRRGCEEQRVSILDSNGECFVPYEVLTEVGEISVNLVGFTSDGTELIEQLTTYPIKAFNNNRKAFTDGDGTEPITPDQFQQFVAAVHEDSVNAINAKNEAVSAKEATESLKDETQQIFEATGQLRNETEGFRNQTETLKSDVQGLKTDVENLKSDTQQIFEATGELRDQTEDLRDETKVLHDETKDYVDEINHISAVGHELSPDQEAYANYENGVINIGIPKGDKGDKGNVNFATFELDPVTGYLYMNYNDEYTGPQFRLNDDGYIEVII